MSPSFRTAASQRAQLGTVLLFALLAAACGSATSSGSTPDATAETGVGQSDSAAPSTVGPDPAHSANTQATTVRTQAVDTSTVATESTATDNAGASAGQRNLPITVVDDRGKTITIESIERIIPLDGDLAEIVFALGLGDNVVATDISATFPAEADELPEIGYQRALAAEPIAAFEPTVVLATDIAGPPETIDDLEALGYPVVFVPTVKAMDGPGDKIRAVALALGIAAQGEELAATVDNSIAEAVARASREAAAPVRVAAVYVRGENVQLLLGEGSSVHWLIAAVGATDIADELGVVDFAPISAEAMILAAPDVLLIPERGLESVGGVEGLLEIPGLAQTPAGENARVLTYDDQYLLGNGPRTGELLNEIISDLYGDQP